MANKYYYRVPYCCSTYGTMTGYVIANDEEEALEKVENRDTECEDFSDDDSDGYNYYNEDAELELEEEDVEESEPTPNNVIHQPKEDIPCWFLSEINSL